MNEGNIFGEVKLIETQRLKPHPDNPRKELGDLSELTESIKANGVLQNLTVVPMGDNYRVIIGHRRLAAAKQLGVPQMPCVVMDLTPDEQIAMMLTENMQRNDLTLYEQAASFQQLSLNMGKSIEEISSMSGFSQTTIRHRLKVAELEPDGVKVASERGATISDFMELEKIEDPVKRNEVLGYAGTNNFKYYLKAALDEQKYLVILDKWVDKASTFATKIETAGRVGEETVPMSYQSCYARYTSNKEIAIPEDSDSARYFFLVTKSNELRIYREVQQNDEEEKKKAEEKARQEAAEAKISQLHEMNQRHYELRKDFITNFSAFKKYRDAIIRETALMIPALVLNNAWKSPDALAELMGFDSEKHCIYETPEYRQEARKNPERAILLTMWWALDNSTRSYGDRRWSRDLQADMIYYRENTALDELYYFLEELGYETSDEELQMRRGSHPIFDKEEDDG